MYKKARETTHEIMGQHTRWRMTQKIIYNTSYGHKEKTKSFEFDQWIKIRNFQSYVAVSDLISNNATAINETCILRNKIMHNSMWQLAGIILDTSSEVELQLSMRVL